MYLCVFVGLSFLFNMLFLNHWRLWNHVFVKHNSKESKDIDTLFQHRDNEHMNILMGCKYLGGQLVQEILGK